MYYKTPKEITDLLKQIANIEHLVMEMDAAYRELFMAELLTQGWKKFTIAIVREHMPVLHETYYFAPHVILPRGPRVVHGVAGYDNFCDWLYSLNDGEWHHG